MLNRRKFIGIGAFGATVLGCASPWLVRRALASKSNLPANPWSNSAIQFLAEKKPSFSWSFPVAKAGGGKRGRRQLAYQVRVAEDLAALRGGPLLWDSGRVESDACIGVPYQGVPLSAGQRVVYQVQIWDESGKPKMAQEPRECLVAELEPGDWKSQWIGPDPSRYPEESGALMRKERSLREKPLRAFLFVSGLGHYEAFINGVRVGDRQLDPVFSDYVKRVYYSAYEVTDLLQRGSNAVGVHLGNGRYRQIVDATLGDQNADWRGPLKVLFQLRVEFPDGTTEIIGSDEGWKTAPSPIVYCDMFAGETYDARLDQPGWSKPGFDDSGWAQAALLGPPGGKVLFQFCPPTRRFPVREPISVHQTDDGAYFYDFGANISGGITVAVQGAPAAEIRFFKSEYTERLGEGLKQPFPDMIKGGRIQEDRLILGERGQAEFETTFSISGFRYVLVRGVEKENDLARLGAFDIHTDLPVTGRFECSDPRVNALHKLFVRTYLSNMQCGIPTDNPTRERRGYLLDGNQWAEGMFYNCDKAGDFYRKWVYDMADAQQQSGFVPYYAPIGGHQVQGVDGTFPQWTDPWWSNSILSVSLLVYRFTKDRQVLSDLWPAMRQLLVFLDRTYASTSWQAWGLGDWLEVGGKTRAERTPISLTTLAAGVKTAIDGIAIARILEREQEVAFCQRLREGWTRKFNSIFRRPDGALDVRDAQTAWLLDIMLELGDDLEPSKRALVENIRERGGRLSTGILGTHYLPKVLTDIGQADLAWRVVTAEGDWGYMKWVDEGRSTVPETWAGGRAQNQPSLGAIDDWFYRDIAGIAPDLEHPAFKRVRLRPHFIEDLEWSSASVITPFGEVFSEWRRRNGNMIQWTARVPANATAIAELPASAINGRESNTLIADAPGVQLERSVSGSRLHLQSGEYVFHFPA